MSDLIAKLRELEEPPLPGSGSTAERHHALVEIARKDLSLARLAEAHFDALSILAEAGSPAVPGALYAVWASEIKGQTVDARDCMLAGKKRFCTGAGLLDRALITVSGPEHLLVDVDLQANRDTLTVDSSEWITSAFAETATATVSFRNTPYSQDRVLGAPSWYLTRSGFWSGALGPAACWAGGAIGLVDWARKQARSDPHTLAHLGAMEADAWSLRTALAQAGVEIDLHPHEADKNQILALSVRHLVEQACADIMTRLGRAYGPHPLAFDTVISRRYAELELYIRQCHAERDLEQLGTLIMDRLQ